MDIRSALTEQFRAALGMLAQCVEKCPDDLWTTPNPRVDDGDRVIYRAYWRIAFHTAYFTHLYLGQNEAAFNAPPREMAVRRADLESMWRPPWEIEPYELPENSPTSAKADVLSYVAFVYGLVGPTLEALDLESEESGFPWYRNVSKLSHELMNLRHLQGHVGQLSELLMARGVEIDWMSKA